MGTPDNQYGPRRVSDGTAGIVLVGVLTLSRRLRRWTGWAAVWLLALGMACGFTFGNLGDQMGLRSETIKMITTFSLIAIGFSVLLAIAWLAATFFAWTAKIVAEDVSDAGGTRR